MCNNPAKFHQNRSSVFRGVAFTKLFGRKDGRTNADHYYVTPSLRGGGQKRVYGLIIIQLLHLNEINMRFYGVEDNNIERGEAEFNIVVFCSIKPHIDQVQV